jgi:uncharacterized membrane protein YoaK (UPF0700 family)
MVLMILAGIFGLPAAACSTACAAMGQMAGAAQDPNAAGGQAIMETLKWLAIIASIGSIIVGALVRRLGKTVSGASALLFALLFALLLVQANLAGLPSSLLLLVAAIMIFVAPEEQFRRVTRVEQA